MTVAIVADNVPKNTSAKVAIASPSQAPCYCIIKYIEEKKLNDSVGTGHNEPSIKYLQDTGDLDTEPFDNELKGFKQACSRYAKRFGDILAGMLDLFLSLYRAIEDGCVDRARADGVDADLAVFQIDRPCTSKRPYCSLGCTVNS